jgi:phosphoglycolate phosphatase
MPFITYAGDGLLFDLDGTLVDSAPEIMRALNAALQQHGIAPFSLKSTKQMVGRGAPELVKRALAKRAIINPGLADSILHDLLATYAVSFAHTRLYPNVRKTLQRLRHPAAIVTNKPTAPTLALLDHFGIARFFQAVVCGDTLPMKKPDPAPLWYAAGLIGAARPVMLGDSEVDSAAAAAAGMPFIHCAWGYCNGPVKPQITYTRSGHLDGMLDDLDFIFP